MNYARTPHFLFHARQDVFAARDDEKDKRSDLSCEALLHTKNLL